ncbi:MAG: hypothetical protein JWP97_635 [Labilithrix sp.]|nr:hypothetical protein [Labilithrix sp.]
MEVIRSGPDAACRRPEDDHEAEAAEAAKTPGAQTASAKTPNQSEKPRLSCSLDRDWDEALPHEAFGPPAPPPAAPAAPPSLGNSAARTSARDASESPYAAAGYAKDTNSVYVGVAVVKGLDPRSGLEIEAGSVSVQVGEQNEAQATGLRFGNRGGSTTVEAATATAHAGFHNSDGSLGLNGGLLATAVAGEKTFEKGANQLTVGLSISEGAEASIGVRDKDHDDDPELCFRASFGVVTVGACVEIPFHQKM